MLRNGYVWCFVFFDCLTLVHALAHPLMCGFLRIANTVDWTKHFVPWCHEEHAEAQLQELVWTDAEFGQGGVEPAWIWWLEGLAPSRLTCIRNKSPSTTIWNGNILFGLYSKTVNMSRF